MPKALNRQWHLDIELNRVLGEYRTNFFAANIRSLMVIEGDGCGGVVIVKHSLKAAQQH